jgi:hypothetical protein
MVDIQAPPLSSYEVGAGLNPNAPGGPANTYVDFANQLLQNYQNQAQQSELIKQAQLKTQQAQAETLSGQYGNSMTKQQALAELQAAGVPSDQLSSIQSLPDDARIPTATVDQFVRQFGKQFREPQAKTPREGQPFIATAADAKDEDKTDENGSPLVAGQSYQPVATFDADGNVVSTTYIRSGGEALAAAQGKSAAGLNKQQETTWSQKIVPALDVNNRSSRNAIGVAALTLQRAERGEALLKSPTVTYQQLMEVSQDMSTILRGGVATDSSSAGVAYETLQSDIGATLQKLTGKPTDTLPPALKDTLTDSFDRMVAVSKDLIQSEFDFYRSAYPDIIAAHQNAFDAMQNSALNPTHTAMDQYLAQSRTGQPAVTPTGFLGNLYDTVTAPFRATGTQAAPPAPTTPPSQAQVGTTKSGFSYKVQ